MGSFDLQDWHIEQTGGLLRLVPGGAAGVAEKRSASVTATVLMLTPRMAMIKGMTGTLGDTFGEQRINTMKLRECLRRMNIRLVIAERKDGGTLPYARQARVEDFEDLLVMDIK